MVTLHPTRPPGKTGARDDDLRPPGARRSTGRTGRPLDYPFDPVPKIATDMVASRQPLPPRPRGDGDGPPPRSDRLLSIDLAVLAFLIRLASRVKTSCWTTRAFLAKQLGVSEATVKRSLNRLRRAGLIRQVAVEKPDPDEPRNKTGWRYVFAWMEAEVAGPARAPGGSPVTPPGDHARPLPGIIRDPQSKTEGNSILPPEGRDESKATMTAGAAESSSSSSSLDREEKTSDVPAPTAAEPVGSPAAPEPGRSPAEKAAVAQLGPEWAPAVEALGQHWREPATVAAGLKGKHPALAPEMMLAAIAALGLAIRRGRKIENPTGYLINTVGQMAAEGWKPPVDPAKAKAEERARREAEARAAFAAEAEASWEAAEARLKDLGPEERRAQAREILERSRKFGRYWEWRGGYYELRRAAWACDTSWSPENEGVFQALFDDITAILDEERAAADRLREWQVDAARRGDAGKFVLEVQRAGTFFTLSADSDGRVALRPKPGYGADAMNLLVARQQRATLQAQLDGVDQAEVLDLLRSFPGAAESRDVTVPPPRRGLPPVAERSAAAVPHHRGFPVPSIPMDNSPWYSRAPEEYTHPEHRELAETPEQRAQRLEDERRNAEAKCRRDDAAKLMDDACMRRPGQRGTSTLGLRIDRGGAIVLFDPVAPGDVDSLRPHERADYERRSADLAARQAAFLERVRGAGLEAEVRGIFEARTEVAS